MRAIDADAVTARTEHRETTMALAKAVAERKQLAAELRLAE